MNRKDLALLLDMKRPDVVFDEVALIVKRLSPGIDMGGVKEIFDDTVALYSGRYPGYRECNIGYHDLRHTTDVLLCMMRLMHGMTLQGMKFSDREIFLGLASALMHDTGYIQEIGDTEGTGAKYTKDHVQRSVDFMQRYFEKNKYGEEDFDFARGLVLATSVDIKFHDIFFRDESNRIMGKMMFASDLIGQIADRIYPEKLLFLYREFREGKVDGFESEWDLLNKTKGFHGYVINRVGDDLAIYTRAFRSHFLDRWDIDNDYYTQAMEGNVKDLCKILEESGMNYRSRLRREGIVKQIMDTEGMQ